MGLGQNEYVNEMWQSSSTVIGRWTERSISLLYRIIPQQEVAIHDQCHWPMDWKIYSLIIIYRIVRQQDVAILEPPNWPMGWTERSRLFAYYNLSHRTSTRFGNPRAPSLADGLKYLFATSLIIIYRIVRQQYVAIFEHRHWRIDWKIYLLIIIYRIAFIIVIALMNIHEIACEWHHWAMECPIKMGLAAMGSSILCRSAHI